VKDKSIQEQQTRPAMRRIETIHFIGIGGAGMGGITSAPALIKRSVIALCAISEPVMR
jgi:hypothetical protein